MKRLLLLTTIIVILSLFTLCVSAEETVDNYINSFEEALPDEFSGITDPDKLSGFVSLDSLVSGIISRLTDGRADITSFALVLLGCSILMGVASLCHDKTSDITLAASGLVSSILIFSSLNPLTELVSGEVEKISDFFSSLIPIFVGITAFGGGGSTASVQAVGMSTALSCVGGLVGKIFLSLSSFGMAISLLCAFGSEGINSVFKGLRGLFNWVTGIFTALLTATFSLQTLVASSADSAAMRAAKYAASGLIPVVGSTVSGAISTLSSGLSYAKGIVGGGAVAVILYMAIGPLALLLCYRLVISLCIILCDFMSVSLASKILTSFRFALDMTVTLYALSALIYLFEVIIFIRTGVAIG